MTKLLWVTHYVPSVSMGGGDVADCLFCKIVTGDVPATVVKETPAAVAFRDINPQAPTHVLVITREHHPDLADLTRRNPVLLGELLDTAVSVAEDEGIVDPGYRVVFNSGAGAGQTVFHVHAHVLGGRGLSWPPG